MAQNRPEEIKIKPLEETPKCAKVLINDSAFLCSKSRKNRNRVYLFVYCHPYSPGKQKFYHANFFASSINFAKPTSVNGCLVSPIIESKGQVQTLASASAHLII